MSTPNEVLVSRMIGALSGVLFRHAEPESVLGTILQQAVERTGATRGVFVEVTAGGELAFRVLQSYHAHMLADRGHYSRRVFATCLSTGEDLVLANAVADLPGDAGGSVMLYRMAAVLCMPIRVGGRIAALVHLESGEAGHFDDSHRRLLRPLLDLAAPVLEALAAGRAMLEERDRLDDAAERLRVEAEESRARLARDWSFGRFVGRSAPVRELEGAVRRAAAAPWPVLLVGETGTGKSILARVLHSAGPRAQRAFVTVFCPSLERSMVEAELFGHRRGAFTGAAADRAGKVQVAEGGTLFLDEVGDLPLEIQPKLLRLLQERAYERLGDPTERHADVRVIAATSRDLEREVREGRFRRDLFERLEFLPVRVPPLRERREDIPLILRHCLDQTEAGRWIEIEPPALEHLQALEHDWPGNVRDLEQLAARLTVTAPSSPVDAATLARLLDARPAPAPAEAPAAEVAREPAPAKEASGDDGGLARALLDAERVLLVEALRRHPQLTRAQLAARLKISETALYKKLRRHHLLR